MFTGIVEGTGRVRSLSQGARGGRLCLEVPRGLGRLLEEGESLAVNGCCLTVTSKGNGSVSADLSPETLRVTNLGRLKTGASVNLERSVRVGDRLGGHLVQGHVDTQGEVVFLKRGSEGGIVEIRVPQKIQRYVVPKGSICVDGVSLTVGEVKKDRVTLYLIPETYRRTRFGSLSRGESVNLEVDILSKYVESLLNYKRKKAPWVRARPQK